MPTIRSTLQLHDGLSGPAGKIYLRINTLVGGFENLKASVSESLPAAKFEAAGGGIRKAETAVSGLNNKFQQTDDPINQANRAQKNFNNSINNGSTAANGLISRITGIVAAYATLQTGKAVLGVSDTLASTKARLDMINDGTQTTAQLNEKVYQAAEQSRGSYTAMAASVSKLGLLAGDAFQSNDEVIQFTKLMQQAYTVAGASAEEAKSSMYQMTQAMASGRLQGDEFRSIMEGAPMVARAIADYMGVSMGELKNLASQGVITSDVIKNALFMAGDDIEAKFANMPRKFSNIWTSIKNKAVKSFDPVLSKLNEIANTERFQKFVDGAGVIFSTINDFALKIIDAFGKVTQFVQQHSQVIMGSLLVLAIVATSAGLAMAIAWAIANWPLLLMIALVAALVTAFIEGGGTMTEIIAGVGRTFGMLYAFLYNLFADLYNLVAIFAEFLANVFNDPVSAIYRLFYDLVAWILDLLSTVASAIDAVFGSNIQDAISGWSKSLQDWTDEIFGQDAISIERMTKIDGTEIGDQWEKGAADAFEKLKSNLGNLTEGDKTSWAKDIMDNLEKYSADTAANTGATADSIDIAQEDLKTMRELAEMKSIQNFVTLTPTVTVTTGDIHNESNVNDMITKIERALSVEIGASSAYVMGVG